MNQNLQLRGPDAPIGQGKNSGFFGNQWQERPGQGAVLMCDSYVMNAPTFPLHPHRNISAVAILFEDTVGQMYSADSIGTNHRFGAGDVHWTLAGNGIEHTQIPEDEANIHAVQMFIELPQVLHFAPAMTFHLLAKDVPIYKTSICRIRVLVGSAFGLTSPLKIPQDILILEGWTESDFEIPVPSGWKLWLYDRCDERAGYSSQPIVCGQFLAVASPTSVMF